MSQITSAINRLYDLIDTRFAVLGRGIPPVLLDASTNAAGSKIILTFNKVMSVYMFTGIAATFTASTKTVSSVARGSNTATIELTLNTSYVNGNIITLTYSAAVPLEAIDLGLVSAFTGISVTNIVPA